jgi:hypothetical protein
MEILNVDQYFVVWQTVLPYYLVEAITLSKMSHQSINLFPIHVRFNEPERERDREGRMGRKKNPERDNSMVFFPQSFCVLFPKEYRRA